MKRLLVASLALIALTSSAFASTDGTGFATGPCALPAGAPVPGSGTVHIAGPAASYPASGVTPAQAAIDAAEEGDTILLTPGTYRESLKVRTDGLRIRGTDRNGVVFDGSPIAGQGQLEIGIDVTGPDRVVVENLTVHNYSRHGVFFYHVKGYWARYITAYNMGLYGIYAFDSRCGQIDRSYASGNADSGFYVGECFPCDAVITNIVAEGNALGYSGTNAGGNLTLRDSIWRDNGLGIVPNSLDGEDRPPQRGLIIRHNVIDDNNNKLAPGVSLGGLFWGVGVAIAGGHGNQVYGNQITDHGMAGVVLAPLPDDNLWIPAGNTIWGNTVTHDANEWPDAFDLGQGVTSGANNCWADNEFGNSAPDMIEDVWSCAFTATPPGGDPRAEIGLAQGFAGTNGRAPSDWRTWPAPAAQSTQPSDNGTADFADDGAVDTWLPASGMDSN